LATLGDILGGFWRFFGDFWQKTPGRLKVPILAEVGDFLSIWQLPVILVLAGVWIIWGGYLMRRAVRDHVGRREAELNRCVVIALLAGLGGAVSAFLVFGIERVWRLGERLEIQALWLVLPAAAVVFCLVSFLTVFASFQLPGGSLGKVWLKSFGPPLLVAAVAAVPTVWVANGAHQNILAKNRSVTGLQLIYKEIAARYAPARPPASIEDLTKQNVVPPRAYRHPSRSIGFFYMPAPMQPISEPTSRLLACDWADNQSGNLRAVLYVNGVVDMAGAGKFQELLARDENKAFAAALKEAEKKLSSDN
jgi:hypothetical protein